MLKAARMNVVATAGDAIPRRLAMAAARRAKRARDDFMFGGFCFVRFLLIYEKLLHWEIADGCSKRTLADIYLSKDLPSLSIRNLLRSPCKIFASAILDFFADFIYCPQSIISRAHLFCCLKRISILSHPPHQTCPTNQLPRRSRCVCACSSVATAGLAFGHGASRFDLIHSIPMHFRPKPIFMG